MRKGFGSRTMFVWPTQRLMSRLFSDQSQGCRFNQLTVLCTIALPGRRKKTYAQCQTTLLELLFHDQPTRIASSATHATCHRVRRLAGTCSLCKPTKRHLCGERRTFGWWAQQRSDALRCSPNEAEHGKNREAASAHRDPDAGTTGCCVAKSGVCCICIHVESVQQRAMPSAGWRWHAS